jgi:hypothetical protein
LNCDLGSARYYRALAAQARTNGLGFPTPDGYIAAIASVHGFAIASRDTGPFTAAGLKVVNPWDFFDYAMVAQIRRKLATVDMSKVSRIVALLVVRTGL